MCYYLYMKLEYDYDDVVHETLVYGSLMTVYADIILRYKNLLLGTPFISIIIFTTLFFSLIFFIIYKQLFWTWFNTITFILLLVS